jgi:hemerythrin
MNLFAWDPKYCLNIAEIDSQHEHLFALFNVLYDALQQGRAADVIGEVLEDVVDYAGYHFAHEEALFLHFGYPDQLAHQAEHEELAQQARLLSQKLHDGQKDVSLATLKFMSDWLTNHILGSDMKYASFLIEKGVR